MKTPGAIKHKLNQVRFRHLKKRLEAELRQAPENCCFNVEVPPPSVPTGEKLDGMDLCFPVPEPNPVGLRMCLYGAGDPMTWKPSFCDERVDGGARARQCTLFHSRKSKEELKVEFTQTLERMTLPEVAFHYPDMAALIWVLDESDISAPVDGVPAQEEPQIAGVPEPVQPAQAEGVSPEVQVSSPRDTPPAPHSPSVLDEPLPEKKPWWAKWLGT